MFCHSKIKFISSHHHVISSIYISWRLEVCKGYFSIQVSGKRSDIDNYCPISVISIIGKVFERIIYYQLFANLSDHITLSKHQPGIHVPPFSSNTALLGACNIDIGNVNAVALLDLKKAFDTVNHDILLSKLHLYSISGVTHKCFSSYLDNHTQKCLVNGSLSECCTVKCGFPQGKILGPLNCFCYTSMICPIGCFILNKDCMLMIPI